MTTLTFLGTGGGRFTTLFQERATGGLYLEDGPTRLHIDPGPGSLNQLHRAGKDPRETTGVLVTHRHLDHCNDANLVIEGMTRGGTEERGFLAGSVSVLEGLNGEPPIITPRHRGLVTDYEVARAGESARVSGTRVEFLETEHRDPTNVGFKLHTDGGVVSYFTDTVVREDLLDQLEGSRAIVLGVTRPKGARIPDHLSTEDAVDVAERYEPDVLVLTHLGLKLLRQGAELEAEHVQRQTGVRTVAARDLTRVALDEDVHVDHPEEAADPPEAKS